MEWGLVLVAAFASAFFSIGGGIIFLYLKKGQVTEDHLKKGDIDGLKDWIKQLNEEFKSHIDKHNTCEKDFVGKEQFEKHIHECPIKQIVDDMKNHEIRHGSFESRVEQRLISLDDFVKVTTKSLRFYAGQLSEINTNLQVLIRAFEDHKEENGKKWDGIDRRKGNGA